MTERTEPLTDPTADRLVTFADSLTFYLGSLGFADEWAAITTAQLVAVWISKLGEES